MNPKQTIPLIATLAPVAPAIAPFIPAILVGGAIFLVLKCLLSDDDEKENKSETVPANAENQRKEAETVQKIPTFRTIPAEIPAKPISVSIPSAPKPIILPVSVPSVLKVSATQIPSPIKKKFVTRNDLATIFQRGARALNKTAAVAALKKIGFGKSAAYQALTPDGRFSAWLQFAPDGIITWTE
jgi:hypothetical protein